MITLVQKQELILKYYREGESQREISRQTGISRKTISKYIKQYEEKRQQLLASKDGTDNSILIEAIVESPKYTVGERPKRKLTEEMVQKIQAHLDENKEKKNKGQRKQLKKPMDIYESLKAEDYDISYSTVLRTVRNLAEKPREAFIKAIYQPGEICEFDWGAVKLTVGGKMRVFQMAVFTSAYGNYRWSYLFTKQTTECFQEAHARFFEHIGGVYQRMVYDNMKVAVKRFTGNEKEPTQGLLQLALYYGFDYRFCNICKGNEKAHVERSVEVIRRKAFAFCDTFETLAEANHYLLEICQKRNQKEQQAYAGQSAYCRLKEERPYLLPPVPAFDAARTCYARVDKYATIVVDQNHYSVPDTHVGKQVFVKIYSGQIQCFFEENKIAEHPRLTGNHEWAMQLTHYLETYKKKPGALAGSMALQQADQKLQNIYHSHYIKREKEFIELIHYIQQGTSLVEVEKSIQELSQIHPKHISTDKIKILCAKKIETPSILDALVNISEETQEITDQALRHLKLYDKLLQETGVSIA
ncbi:IS21 family transposase [Peptococcaceae bacterium]|nr:IS21 family transposase [Peptococcaceae bacterium]